MSGERFYYQGFNSPNYTQVPDDVFDVIAPELTEAELRVLLYIVRRTFGFKKHSDAISLSQLVDGLKTRDGRVLDKGTGMSRRGVMKGCAGLVEKGIITVERRLSEQGDNEINIYSLRIRQEQGVGNVVPYGREPSAPGVGNQVAPQQTVLQQTDLSHSKIRKVSPSIAEKRVEQPEPLPGPQPHSRGLEAIDATLKRRGRPPRQPVYDEDREVILAYVSDFSREFADRAPLKSSTTRALNLYRLSGLERQTFLDALYQARVITKERTVAIRGSSGTSTTGAKNKMAYFFSVLEDVLGLKDAAASPPTPQ